MKRFLGILIGLILLAPFLLSQESKPVAYISDLEGEVLFQGFERAELNIPIFQGDELNAKRGRAEVCLGNGNFLRLDHYTKVVFATLNEESVFLYIWGNIYLRINTGTIEVQTASEYASLGTGLHLIEDGTIYSGIIAIQNDFDEYNDRREREFTYHARQRYLPEELNDYEYALLYNYGGWRHDPMYGYVWIPCVRPDWNPYFYGRWVYYPYYGWTWISYDGPWGWVVFHYGRWHWHPVWGCWYWIPTGIWGPAWVYWYWGYDCIGWYPMWHQHQQHHDHHYISNHERGLTVIRKDQLQRGDSVSSIIGKEQLREKLPQKIEVKQLRTSLEIAIAPEKRISDRISETKQTQTKQTQSARGTITREPTRSGTTAVSSRKKVSSSKEQTSSSTSSKGTVSRSKRQTSSSKGTTVSSSKKKTSGGSKKAVSSSKKKTSGSKGKTSGSKSSGKVKKKK